MARFLSSAAAACVALCLLLPPAVAKNARAVRKTVEHSVLLKGNISVDARGRVVDASLDEPARIPPGVAPFVLDRVSRWEFEPARDEAGQPVPATAPMNLRVVASRAEGGGHVLSIRSASFQAYDPDDLTQLAYRKMIAPSYPKDAVRVRVEGDVYVVVKVGRDGQVEDASVRQVNLHVVGSERSMDRMRTMLASTSVKTIRQWTFRTPTEGALADRPCWYAVVPIAFRLGTPDGVDPGSDPFAWTAYVPGPVQPIPWADGSADTPQSPDALPGRGVYTDRADGLRLLTALK